jgi:hypothetical protein
MSVGKNKFWCPNHCLHFSKHSVLLDQYGRRFPQGVPFQDNLMFVSKPRTYKNEAQLGCPTIGLALSLTKKTKRVGHRRLQGVNTLGY